VLASCVDLSPPALPNVRQLQYGNVNEQVQLVSEQISAIPELQDGFDAIGFSQGNSRA
jgi:hypothetical protein